MARIEEYRAQVQQVLREYASYKPSYGDIEGQTVFDTQDDHSEVVHVGWHNDRRVHGCGLHMDIKEGKIWIQHDGTKIGIAKELLAAGVPKEDSVLAFHAPDKRQFTGFAVQ